MTDDVATPEPEPAADRPTKRRPPSQSDIHGISSIASQPRERPGGEARDVRLPEGGEPDVAARHPTGTTPDAAARDEG